jgi:hypothetical protein
MVFGAVAEFTDVDVAIALAGLATVCVAMCVAPWRTRHGQ